MYHMKILLGDFNAKVGRENIFQPTIGTESVHPVRDSIKASAKEKVGILETIRNKPWFDEECSELANKRKQTKLLWP